MNESLSNFRNNEICTINQKVKEVKEVKITGLVMKIFICNIKKTKRNYTEQNVRISTDLSNNLTALFETSNTSWKSTIAELPIQYVITTLQKTSPIHNIYTQSSAYSHTHTHTHVHEQVVNINRLGQQLVRQISPT